VFSFPIDQGKTRAATNVSMWEQFALLATLQREWADNMVSCTIYFQPESEGSHIEHALGQFIPLIKSVSMLPHTENGVYAQAPYEGIDLEKYKQLAAEIKRIDWSDYGGTDGEMPTYCTNGVCELPSK
jgi:ribonucleoside-diphosphate reductase alpha chain